ncbi:MAG: 2-polyprenyl-3-methyl-5-hydroxy-6-metoxy-1 4-benzoquinol methylase [Rhodospirillaceae bacterium]|nr:MAG: 2-polyprenyl-3-methyl-5-hydroxy-6-metoxy-1 4-benzoquinol methylase [Rhodospirillaceae bacterium]
MCWENWWHCRAGRVVNNVGSWGWGPGALHGPAGGLCPGNRNTRLSPLARANAVATETDNVLFVQGEAECLPLPAQGVDVAVFFNSFHHVSSPEQALAESARVLKPEGLLYVAEPVATGPFFALCQPVDDETRVRGAAAQTVLRMAVRHDLAIETERTYLHTIVLKDFSSFCERLIAVDSKQAARVARMESALREAYARLGVPSVGGSRAFNQPMRVDLLRKVTSAVQTA